VEVMTEEELIKHNLLVWIEDEVDNAYMEKLITITKMDRPTLKKEKNLGIVFTPLHGTAEGLVLQGLEQLNFTNVSVVEEQAIPDPEFRTVESPNPEEEQSFTYATALGKEKKAD